MQRSDFCFQKERKRDEEKEKEQQRRRKGGKENNSIASYSLLLVGLMERAAAIPSLKVTLQKTLKVIVRFSQRNRGIR